jgi:scyllo-inosose 3-dehydrogenase
MRGMLVEAEWAPRPEYHVEADDALSHLARNGNQVWRNPTFRVAELPEPEIGADGVLIRVRACGICGSDVHMFERDADGYMVYPGMIRTPVVTGHEFSGVVERVGEDVVGLRPGDPVCSEEIAWCGSCDACRAGQPNYCQRLTELGFTFNGAHADKVLTREKYCWPIGALVERFGPQRGFEAGALVEPTSVAYIGMFVQSSFRPGANVGVIGGGPIGLAAVGLARAAGAARIVAMEPSATRRQLAIAMGADAAYDPRSLGPTGIMQAVLDETRGRGMDMWVEASGAPGVIEAAVAALARNGTALLLGLGPHHAELDPVSVIRMGTRVQGSMGHSGAGAFGNVIRLMAADRLDMTRIVTTRVRLEDAVGCLVQLRDREAGKCMVVFDELA